MRHGTQACVGQRDFVFVGFDIGLQLSEIGGGEVFACQQRHGHVGNLANVLKVFQRVVSELFVQRRCRGHAHVVQKDGVTVGRSARHFARANGATCTYRVFYQHSLTQRFTHGNRDHAGHHIGGATGCEGHHQADGLVGESCLRKRWHCG